MGNTAMGHTTTNNTTMNPTRAPSARGGAGRARRARVGMIRAVARGVLVGVAWMTGVTGVTGVTGAAGVARADDREASFAGGGAGVTLAGTLTTPTWEGPWPAVVMVTGSGPQDRDESLLGQKPFLAIAESLRAAGIAALRYDDRGVGASTGDFSASTTDDFAADAAAAVAWLAEQPGIDRERIAVLGHSEGAIIAAILAANPGVPIRAGVMLAGSGVNGLEVLNDQLAAIMQAAGVAGPAIADVRAKHRAMIEAVPRGLDATREAARALIVAQARSITGQDPSAAQVDAAAEQAVAQLGSPWMRRFIALDPAPAVRASTRPLLIMLGTKDLQVTPSLNAGPLLEAMSAAGVRGSELVVMQGKNHLFQEAQTGLIQEYGLIDHPIAEETLERIAVWLNRRFSESS